jgi:predicted ABC-type ATPase
VKLIVLRGPSGSGKSTVARELRRRLGDGIAVVEQDVIGRVVLGRRLTDDGVSAGPMEALATAALRVAPAVLVEGLLSAERYGPTLARLSAIEGVQSWFYAFDLPFEETVARHATREKAGSFGEDELRRWWAGRDPLDGIPETLIGPESGVEATAGRIIADAGLAPGTLLP